MLLMLASGDVFRLKAEATWSEGATGRISLGFGWAGLFEREDPDVVII